MVQRLEVVGDAPPEYENASNPEAVDVMIKGAEPIAMDSIPKSLWFVMAASSAPAAAERTLVLHWPAVSSELTTICIEPSASRSATGSMNAMSPPVGAKIFDQETTSCGVGPPWYRRTNSRRSSPALAMFLMQTSSSPG